MALQAHTYRLLAQRHRFHGGAQGRACRHHQGRRPARLGRQLLSSPSHQHNHGVILWRWKLCHGRPVLQASIPLLMANREVQCHGA